MQVSTSIAKVCRLLDTFRTRPSLGIKELAAETGFLPSDVHRILSSLVPFGYIEQDPHTKKYHLGLQVLKLGYGALQRLEVRQVARPFLSQLSETFEATANMAIADAREREILFIEQIDSPAELQIRLRIGARASPHTTAVGKVLSAFMPPELSREFLKKSGMQKCTRHTITDLTQLEREFERIRSRGYAVDREEAVEGACCVAAPVRDHAGEVIAAVSVSMMSGRFNRRTESELASVVKATAGKISAALGYEPAEARKARFVSSTRVSTG